MKTATAKMSLSRMIRVVLALALSITIGGLTLLILSPLAGDTIIAAAFRFMETVLSSPEPEEIVQYTATSISRLMMLLLAAPILLTSCIGLVAGWRSSLWYISGTAIITAAIPWLMRAELQQPTPGELRVSAYLAAVGAITGLVYWLIAVPAGIREKATASIPQNES